MNELQFSTVINQQASRVHPNIDSDSYFSLISTSLWINFKTFYFAQSSFVCCSCSLLAFYDDVDRHVHVQLFTQLFTSQTKQWTIQAVAKSRSSSPRTTSRVICRRFTSRVVATLRTKMSWRIWWCNPRDVHPRSLHCVVRQCLWRSESSSWTCSPVPTEAVDRSTRRLPFWRRTTWRMCRRCGTARWESEFNSLNLRQHLTVNFLVIRFICRCRRCTQNWFLCWESRSPWRTSYQRERKRPRISTRASTCSFTSPALPSWSSYTQHILGTVNSSPSSTHTKLKAATNKDWAAGSESSATEASTFVSVLSLSESGQWCTRGWSLGNISNWRKTINARTLW